MKKQAALTSKNQGRNSQTMSDLGAVILSSRGAEALSKIQAASKVNQAPDFLTHLPQIRGKDGVDHINTSVIATTPVGKVLSMFDPNPYYDSLLGTDVTSLMAMNVFLKSGGKRVGVLLKTSFKNHPRASEQKPAAESNALMAHALYEKFKSVAGFKDLLVEVNAPLEWYVRSNTTQRIFRTAEGAVYLVALRTIRTAFQEDREPALWKFLDQEEDRRRIKAMSPDQRYAAFLDVLRGALAEPIRALASMKKTSAAEKKTEATVAVEAEKPAATPTTRGVLDDLSQPAPAVAETAVDSSNPADLLNHGNMDWKPETVQTAGLIGELTGEQQDAMLQQAQADGSMVDMGALRAATQVDLGRRSNGPLSRFTAAREAIAEPARTPAPQEPEELKKEENAAATEQDLDLISQVAEKAGD